MTSDVQNVRVYADLYRYDCDLKDGRIKKGEPCAMLARDPKHLEEVERLPLPDGMRPAPCFNGGIPRALSDQRIADAVGDLKKLIEEAPPLQRWDAAWFVKIETQGPDIWIGGPDIPDPRHLSNLTSSILRTAQRFFDPRVLPWCMNPIIPMDMLKEERHTLVRMEALVRDAQLNNLHVHRLVAPEPEFLQWLNDEIFGLLDKLPDEKPVNLWPNGPHFWTAHKYCANNQRIFMPDSWEYKPTYLYRAREGHLKPIEWEAANGMCGFESKMFLGRHEGADGWSTAYVLREAATRLIYRWLQRGDRIAVYRPGFPALSDGMRL